MTTCIRDNVQIIEKDGKPEYAILPYSDFETLENLALKVEDEVTFPQAVAEKIMLEKMTYLKAWRLHLRLTQKKLAAKAGITQAALSQMEKSENPHRTTLEKLAKAMDLDVSQLHE